MRRRPVLPLLLLLVAPAACGDDGDPAGDADEISLRERLTTIDDEVAVWGRAESIADAHARAEAAANLVVGPDGPDYGDRDGDGTVGGQNEFGILQGVDGTPVGLADALSDIDCVAADVLGGAWDDPAARWAELDAVVADWTPSDNTMPQLASHPMRIVGWATLALASDSLDDVHEYADHAELHVDASLDAIACEQ